MELHELKLFLGWMTAINFAMLMLATTFLVLFGNVAKKMHSSLFDLEAAQLRPMYFWYLAIYKIFWIVFNLVPYIAISAMGY